MDKITDFGSLLLAIAYFPIIPLFCSYSDLFETWLTRILINECHKELRRRSRFSGEESLPENAGPDAYEHLPLKEAIRRLPEELRSVVILRFFAGYTQAETAAALEVPQGTVATRQRRALELLRLELGEEASP